MRMKTSCVRSSAASGFDVKRYARLKIRLEKAWTISSHATPSPARALRTSSAPFVCTAAFRASKCLLLREKMPSQPALSKLFYDSKCLKVPTKTSIPEILLQGASGTMKVDCNGLAGITAQTHSELGDRRSLRTAGSSCPPSTAGQTRSRLMGERRSCRTCRRRHGRQEPECRHLCRTEPSTSTRVIGRNNTVARSFKLECGNQTIAASLIRPFTDRRLLHVGRIYGTYAFGVGMSPAVPKFSISVPAVERCTNHVFADGRNTPASNLLSPS